MKLYFPEQLSLCATKCWNKFTISNASIRKKSISESCHIFRSIFFVCAWANGFQLVHSFDMFDRALNLPLHVLLWVNISWSPYSSSVTKIRILYSGDAFHNFNIKKFVLLVALLNRELHYKFFGNHILFIVIARYCHYKIK